MSQTSIFTCYRTLKIDEIIQNPLIFRRKMAPSSWFSGPHRHKIECKHPICVHLSLASYQIIHEFGPFNKFQFHGISYSFPSLRPKKIKSAGIEAATGAKYRKQPLTGDAIQVQIIINKATTGMSSEICFFLNSSNPISTMIHVYNAILFVRFKTGILSHRFAQWFKSCLPVSMASI